MKHYSLYAVFACAIIAFSCEGRNKSGEFIVTTATRIDSMNGACPNLTKDGSGKLFLSWAKSLNDSVSAFCFVTSTDGGQTFSKPITVPMSNNLQAHSENLPRMIVKPSGELVALWGAANPNPANRYAGTVYYSRSCDNGSTWSKPSLLVNDTSGYDQRYYDVAALPGGEVGVIWLDNRTTGAVPGSALYFAVTGKTGEFEKERKIAEGCCQCCRTDLYADGRGGIHVLYRGIIRDSIRDMLHIVSLDGGQTFSSPALISHDNWVIKGCPHTGPSMTENAGLHFAWFTGGRNKGCFYTQSRDNGSSYDIADRISEHGSHPQIVSLGEKLLITWDEPVRQGDSYGKKVGVQLRDLKGNNNGQQFVTDSGVNASYPVLAAVDHKQFLLAYTVKEQERSFVMVQRAKIK